MISDTDWSLLMITLDKLDTRLKKLEADVIVLNAYVDTQLANKYKPVYEPIPYWFSPAFKLTIT